MLTIEVSEEEEEENKEGSEEEEEAEEDKTEGILVEKHTRDSKDITKGSSLPEERHAVRRLNSTDKFQAAVTKIKLGMRVIKSLQFHTTKTVARAIDVEGERTQDRPRRQKIRSVSADLGHFPAVLRMICRSIRTTEQCYLVVELVSPHPTTILQYFVVLRHANNEGLNEDMMLGIEVDVEEDILKAMHFCVGIPITSRVTVRLEDGDGSFMICDARRSLILKPSNVQSQWAAIQFLTGSLQNAAENTYSGQGQSHQWSSYYANLVTTFNEKYPNRENWKISNIPLSPRRSILEIFDAKLGTPLPEISTTKSVIDTDHENISQIRSLDELAKLMVKTIREIMYSIDLDEASSKSIRAEMEARLGIDLAHQKSFIEEKILMTLGQMDEPSLIKDYLFLGTEWNACNYDELIENGVTHVLNVTSEIDSCFKSSFIYHRVDVLDIPQANLLKNWEKTHQFIKDCKDSNGKVLVHCQRGISRSGSTTISYIMREYGLTEAEASSFVKSRRTCVKPNNGFQKQLEYYGKCICREFASDEEALRRALEHVNLGDIYSDTSSYSHDL